MTSLDHPGFAGSAFRPVAPGLLARAAGAVRYRFFVLAGLLPYLLGTALAYNAAGHLVAGPFVLGLAGVLLVGLGVEGMNEYFDARMGGDRVFASSHRQGRWWHLPMGICCFALASASAIWLAVLCGWPLIVFAACGGLLALSYLMPPVRLSHRGLGEAAIAISYGPGLTLGGFFLQAGWISGWTVFVSLVPALAIFALALVNEVPDYYGDRLVGKKNLIVRFGPKAGLGLYAAAWAIWFILLGVGLTMGLFPLICGWSLLLAPLVGWSVLNGRRHVENIRGYVGTVRAAIWLYVIVMAIFIVGYSWR